MHYFIEHTSLPAPPTQTSAQAFGPVPGFLTTKYAVTSRFQLTATAKAFACVKGMMIVQQSDLHSSLVNVIIKPDSEVTGPLESVRYYVYRSLLKDSFLSGTALKPNGAGISARLVRYWAGPHPPSPTQAVLGYDSSLSGGLDVEEVFDNSKTAKPIDVKEGEWIGDFAATHEIGFEVVRFHNHFTATLGYLRAGSHTVETTGLSGFAERTRREQILAFLDPAALFGLHFDVGVSASTYSGATKSTVLKKGGTLYSDLIDKFATRHRVYLDIRSEKGYSYNFYGNYHDGSGNNIKVGNSAATPAAVPYADNSWPIVVIDGALSTSAANNDLKLQVRIDDNLAPLLYFFNKRLLGEKNVKQVILEGDIRNGVAVDWSKDLTFYFPNTGSGASRENVAYYIGLHYFRQEHNAASPADVPLNQTYYDSAFCPLKLPFLGVAAYKQQQVQDPWPTYVRGTFPGTTTAFGYVAQTGAVWDADRIVFYAKNLLPVRNSGEPISPAPSFAKDPGFKFTGTSANGSLLHKQVSVLSNELNESAVGDIKVLEVIHNSASPGFKENIITLGLIRSELTALQNITGLSDEHGTYIRLEEVSGSPFADTTRSIPFRKFAVKLMGYSAGGVREVKSPAAAIHVYTKDGFTFSSREFGTTEGIINKDKLGLIFDGAEMRKWTGYVDDDREANVRALIESVCAQPQVRDFIFPSFFCTIAIGEGLNLWINDNYDPSPPHNILIDNRINGFDYLGVDHFTSDFGRYDEYLPAGFNQGDEFVDFIAVNEQGATVHSADFRDLESGLQGAAAVLAHRVNIFLDDARSLKYGKPTVDELVYWTYVYYQGEGRAQNYLESNGGYDFAKTAPGKMRAVRNLALARTAIWWTFKMSNFFSK